MGRGNGEADHWVGPSVNCGKVSFAQRGWWLTHGGLMRQFQIGQLPSTVLQNAARFIGEHSTVLIHDNDIIGSGTFARVGERHGILTAHHVPNNPRSPFKFGPDSGDTLGISVEATVHAFWLPLRYLVPHAIGEPKEEEFGPDLMFLEIPPSAQLQTIRAKRSFWNISFRAQERTAICYSDTNCLWSIAGYPGEWRRDEAPSHGFGAVYGFPNLIGYTGVENRLEKYGFDYFEVAVDYRSQTPLPTTFGGCSGGGLWRIPISLPAENSPLEQLRTGDPVLSGVMFYETGLQRNRLFIRSHGAKSIYEVLARRLSER